MVEQKLTTQQIEPKRLKYQRTEDLTKPVRVGRASIGCDTRDTVVPLGSQNSGISHNR